MAPRRRGLACSSWPCLWWRASFTFRCGCAKHVDVVVAGQPVRTERTAVTAAAAAVAVVAAALIVVAAGVRLRRRLRRRGPLTHIPNPIRCLRICQKAGQGGNLRALQQ